MTADLRGHVEHVLRTDIARALELDGASIDVLDVTDGIARVRLGGTCASCPATLMTVLTQLESELRTRIPEVEFLEAVR